MTPARDHGLLPGQGRWAEVRARGADQVLKLYRAGHPRERIEQEAASARAAFAAGVPTPRVLDVVTVEGRVGIVFERAEGPTLLEALSARPAGVVALAADFAALHAAMHAREADGVPPQRPALRDEIARAIEVPPAMRAAASDALDALPDGRGLCHGDYHPLNVVLTAAGLSVLDWYKATSGNVDADVARTLMLLRLTPLPRATGDDARRAIARVRAAFAAAYRGRYAALRPFAADALVRWMAPLAVARLAGDVSAEEREQLLAFVRDVLEGRGAAAVGLGD